MQNILFFLLTLLICSPELLFALSITAYPNIARLPTSFDPVIPAYWTGFKNRRRVNLACAPTKKLCYLAYLDTDEETVLVLTLNSVTFKPTCAAVRIKGHEAGGLVGLDDGFVLLTTVPQNAGDKVRKLATMVRFQGTQKLWETRLNGPKIHPKDGLTETPDCNGDVVWSPKAKLFAAYFVVTAYTGRATQHFADAVQYVREDGTLVDIPENSWWGCSHNTGIAFEAADEPPFASICAEDQGAIWLNTKTRGMSNDGIKISNENTTNGSGGEAMNGMGGSFSNLARFQNSDSYIFAWQSRGSTNLAPNAFMGEGYTTSSPRWLNHNVAVAILPTKDTLKGPQASSEIGAADGDKQINWLTYSNEVDTRNVHVATFNDKLALVSWDRLTKIKCEPLPMTCMGAYDGTAFQLVTAEGAKNGAPIIKDIPVGGDMVTLEDGKICWAYVPTTWDLSTPKTSNFTTDTISIACATLD
ncbi:hypothetical protein O181_033278 [Austropuccinia psidii MF-1]|uniref:Uncharacterized protein n=1 Tax=Austropuccinia psidii MF-1 TaxID=1389203 RepID=A0A9Q3D167_9BASI|nr:hypothetical protein [Austropuccinia psidii MF-1]